MPRNPVPLSINDVSTFAKSLRRELLQRSAPLSHVELLNLLASAGGYRNFQHLRSKPRSPASLHSTGQGSEPENDEAFAAVEKAVRFFDREGRFKIWPARTTLQNLCLWALWARIPSHRTYTEREISQHLNTLHTFGDAAILRRTLCNLGLMSRTMDGRIYRRCEVQPSAEGSALMERLRSSRRGSLKGASATVRWGD